MKITVDREKLQKALDALSIYHDIERSSPERHQSVYDAQGLLLEILKPKPESDLPYLAPELAVKHIEQEYDNRQAIVEILEMLRTFGSSSSIRREGRLAEEAESLQAKLVGEKCS